MSEALVLKKTDAPSYFNKEALIGTLLVPGLGTIIGAMIGKSRMERERYEGKPVGEPDFWNKDTLIGALLGAHLVAALSFQWNFLDQWEQLRAQQSGWRGR